MNKLLKISFSVIALLLTVVLAAVIFLVTLDPNDHKNWIADQFYDRTGRILTLGGEVDLSLFPWFGLSVEDVSVSNPGFGDSPLLQADSAMARIKFLPLLQQTYVIDIVRLQGATINLVVNEDGVSNWSDLVASREQEPVEDDAESGLSFANLVLGGVDIREAALYLDDRSQGVNYAITDLNMSIGELAYGRPLELALSFNASASEPELRAQVELDGMVTYDEGGTRYRISPLQLAATVSGPSVPDGSADLLLGTDIDLDLAADTLLVSNLVLTALDSELSARLSGRNVQTRAPQYEADIHFSGSDLAQLFRLAEVDDLASQVAGLQSQSFDLDAALALDMHAGNLQVSRLQGNLLGATFNGELAASAIHTSAPLLQGRLNAEGPDLPTLIEVAGQFLGGQESALSQYGRQLAAVPDKSFLVDTNFDVNLAAGNASVDPLEIKLLGASLNGNLQASDIQSENAVVRGRLQGQGPDLPLMLQIAGQIAGGPDSALNQYGRQLRAGVAERDFEIEADFDVDLASGNISIPVLTARSLGFQLNGNLATRDANGTLEGSLQLTGENLEEVLGALDQTALGEVSDSLALNVEISGNRNRLDISPLNLVLAFSGDNIPDSPMNLTLSADSQLDLQAQTLALNDFTVSGPDLQVTGELQASNVLQAPEYTGRLEVAPFNLRELLQMLNQDLPAMADPQTLASVGMNGSFSGTGSSLALSQLTARLDETTLQGTLSINDFQSPAIAFDINIDELNADRYLPPAAEREEDPDTPAAVTEIPVQLLRELDLDGELNISRLVASNLHFADFAVLLQAGAGQFTLTPATSLYGGSYEGEISLDVSGERPVMDIRSSLNAIALGDLMQDLIGTTYVSGRGNVELNLDAAGSDSDALKRSLDGTGRVELEDGVLQGVDVGTVLAQVESMIRSRRLMEVQRGEQTAFDTFSATLLVDDGVVSTSNLRVAAPGFRINGEGTLINLNDATILFNLVAEVDPSTATRDSEEYDLGGYSLPIACTGSVSSPRCLPDTQRIIQEALSSAVQDRFSDLLQRALGEDEEEAPADPAAEADPQAPAGADPVEELFNQALEGLLQ